MPTFTLRGHITPDRRLEVQLPPEAPEGEAEVTVTVAVQDPNSLPLGSPERLKAVLEEIRAISPHGSGRTKEEIDRYIQEERDSWGDD
jgi:hypothetical protein